MQRGLILALSAMSFMVSGCGEVVAPPTINDPETTPTQISINLVSSESKDGVRTYVMETPRMERYEQATEPFSLFKEGIKIKTFNDSTQVIESELEADWATYNETKKIWEARGNVIARNYTGDRTLYTEQLWWNEKAKRIYSDTVSKIVEKKSTHIGRGFEADESFEKWIFRKPKGKMTVEMKQDTVAVADSVTVDATDAK